MGFARVTASGIELEIWVVPRASRPALGPLHGERLRVAVSAPPVDGAANEAVRSLVADAMGVARGEVTVVRGTSGRNKTLRVCGDPNALIERLKAQGLDVNSSSANPSDGPKAVQPPKAPTKVLKRSRK